MKEEPPTNKKKTCTWHWEGARDREAVVEKGKCRPCRLLCHRSDVLQAGVGSVYPSFAREWEQIPSQDGVNRCIQSVWSHVGSSSQPQSGDQFLTLNRTGGQWPTITSVCWDGGEMPRRAENTQEGSFRAWLWCPKPARLRRCLPLPDTQPVDNGCFQMCSLVSSSEGKGWIFQSFLCLPDLWSGLLPGGDELIFAKGTLLYIVTVKNSFYMFGQLRGRIWC